MRCRRRMRSKGTILIIVSAAGLGALMAALIPTFLPGSHSLHAWLFGVGLGLVQSLVHLYCCHRAIACPADLPLLGIGSSVLRLIFLLTALAVAILIGLPAGATVGSLLCMYLFMLIAEIFIVARQTHANYGRAA